MNKIYHCQQSDTLHIKYETDDHIGYAEYKPHLSLGYPSIETILNGIDADSFLIQNAINDSLYFQKMIDEKSTSVRNQALFYNGEQYLDSDLIKIKLTGNIENDIENIQVQSAQFSKIRLDANYKYDYQSIIKLLDSIDLSMIDYIEDPVPFNLSIYKKIARKVTVAIDHNFNLAGQSFGPEFHYIYRPTINKLNCNGNDYIFSNQMGGVLDSWHSYCSLVKNGNLELIHGIYNPLIPELYILDGDQLAINKDIVSKCYQSLKELNWKLLI